MHKDSKKSGKLQLFILFITFVLLEIPFSFTMKERLVFVTNDDSYTAKGFAAAIEIAKKFGKVIAIAPDTVQSGKSQAITIYDSLRLKTISQSEDVTIYSLNGTPVDCVKFALDFFLKDKKIDLTISGINHGTNSATNVLYSGTMGAAIESAFYGIPSVGLSNLNDAADADFSTCIEWGTKIIETILAENVPQPVCLNVNIPALQSDQIKGIKVCRQTKGFWLDTFHERIDPYGRKYYWITGGFSNHEPEAQDTDEWALRNGYIAVVPVQVDLTAYDKMQSLAKVLE